MCAEVWIYLHRTPGMMDYRGMRASGPVTGLEVGEGFGVPEEAPNRDQTIRLALNRGIKAL